MKRTLIAIVVLAVLMFAAVALWGRSEIAITIGEEPTPTPERAAGPLLTESEAIGLIHTWYSGVNPEHINRCELTWDDDKSWWVPEARYIPHTEMWVVIAPARTATHGVGDRKISWTVPECAFTVDDRTGKVGPQ
jgi:hypothetical protein